MLTNFQSGCVGPKYVQYIFCKGNFYLNSLLVDSGYWFFCLCMCLFNCFAPMLPGVQDKHILKNIKSLNLTRKIAYCTLLFKFDIQKPGQVVPSCRFKQGSSEKDGRYNVNDCSEFKIVSNCFYPECCCTNFITFVK